MEGFSPAGKIVFVVGFDEDQLGIVVSCGTDASERIEVLEVTRKQVWAEYEKQEGDRSGPAVTASQHEGFRKPLRRYSVFLAVNRPE